MHQEYHRWHSPRVGLAWTFVMLATLSATFYLNLTTQLGWRRMVILLGIRLVALVFLRADCQAGGESDQCRPRCLVRRHR